MQTVVKKWGNSLALRLPQGMAADLQIMEGATVSLSIEDHTLVVKPTRKRYRLSDLLSQMDPKSKRDETDWGSPVGESVLIVAHVSDDRKGTEAALYLPLPIPFPVHGINWRTFWQLRYRPPSDVFVGVYLSLKAAYEAECERQERLLRHEREVTKAKASAFEAVHRTSADMDKQ